MADQPWRIGNKFAIVGGPNIINPNPVGEQLPEYGSWRVVRKDNHDHLICTFYGGASLAAAGTFFEYIEENWELQD